MADALKPILGRLATGAVLDEDEAELFFAACLRGEATPAQVGAAVTAMRVRGETVAEILAFVRAMRAAAVRLDHPYTVLDTCGTGGDGAHTLNISTAAAFVIAGAGQKVAKHGNRALSSRSGSSDVLAALGVKLVVAPDRQRQALDAAGICFLYAPAHHGAMRHVTPIRAELGFRTIFNVLGPLSNPASAQFQVVGVYDPALLEPLARVLGALGLTRAWTVHGQGLDELTTTGPSEVAEWHNGTLRRFSVSPEDLGLARARLDDLRGGEAEDNAAALRALLAGAPGPYRDVVQLNAAAGLVVSGHAPDLKHGLALADRSIDSGAALASLDALIHISNLPDPDPEGAG